VFYNIDLEKALEIKKKNNTIMGIWNLINYSVYAFNLLCKNIQNYLLEAVAADFFIC
jgi:hypothetical protein